MKRMLIAVVAVITFVTIAYSQVGNTETATYEYCEIEESSKFFSSKITIRVDTGEGLTDSPKLRDNLGKELIFRSMVGALNHMNKQGWRLKQVYIPQENQGAIKTPRYLLERKITVQ